MSDTHDFIIRYGGCGASKGVVATFQLPDSIDHDQVILSNTDKTYLHPDRSNCRQADGCFRADMFIGKKDRFGFAVPKGTDWPMKHESVYVSRA